MIKKLIRAKFAYSFEDGLLDEMAATGQYVEVPRGEKLIESGEYMKTFPMLLTGLIKIFREEDEGSEIFLYYLTPGETCAVSLTCCMTAQKSSISAVAEEDAEMIIFPISKLEEWFVKFPSWKGFVMEVYQYRFEELLGTVDALAFQNMNQRLWAYLNERVHIIEQPEIEITHLEIARDLNTSREVVSRLLKGFEKEGMVQLARNRIRVDSDVVPQSFSE